MVRAVLDAIAYQINDVTTLMQQESGYRLPSFASTAVLRKMPTSCSFKRIFLIVPSMYRKRLNSRPLSSLCRWPAVGLYDQDALFKDMKGRSYEPSMAGARRRELIQGWQQAISQTLAVTHQGA